MNDRAGVDRQDASAEARERVLVVDDEPEFCAELATVLRRYGYDVAVAGDAVAMAQALQAFQPTVLVLDQFLADVDMLPRIAQIRAGFRGGLMVLSGNSDFADKVQALEQGADDFIVKTTHPREVLARLRALVRRTAGPIVEPAVPMNPSAPDAQGWTVDIARREVRTPAGDVADLTGLEFDAMRLLYQVPGKVISRECLAREVLQRHVDASGRSIENLMSRLRAKFVPFIGKRPVIRSVRGKGYVFLGFPPVA